VDYPHQKQKFLPTADPPAHKTLPRADATEIKARREEVIAYKKEETQGINWSRKATISPPAILEVLYNYYCFGSSSRYKKSKRCKRIFAGSNHE